MNTDGLSNSSPRSRMASRNFSDSAKHPSPVPVITASTPGRPVLSTARRAAATAIRLMRLKRRNWAGGKNSR